MSSEQFPNEIDLIELLATLWDAKWLIAAITSAFAAISITSAVLMPSNFKGSIRLSTLTNAQMASYQILNDTPGISPPIYQGGTLVGQVGVISKDDLFENFLAQIRQGSSFADAHRRFDPKFRNFDGTNTELTQKLAQISGTYVFKLDKGSNTAGLLSFETDDRKLSQAILKNALEDIRDKSRAENLASISNLRSAIETSLAFELEDINIQIKNALSNYENETTARRALLKEHAAIARQLGNADGQAVTSENNGVNVAVEQQQPLYNRGYVALEKEIALIDARGKGEAALPYVKSYVELAARRLALTSDTRLARIDAGLAATPVSVKDKFKAVNYDLDTVLYEATTSKPLIVILATLMGGIIAMVLALLRNGLSARRNRPTSEAVN